MESKFNYTVVGLFVIVLTAACVIIGVWLTYGLSSQSYSIYNVNMNESVSGLSVKAPVKYNGVDVGYVSRIRLNPKNPQQVQLRLELDTQTPVTVDTTATLMTQGLTGIAYLELKNAGKDFSPLQAGPGEKYPTIKTTPSLMYRLDSAVGVLTENLNNVGNALNAFLTPKNQKALRQTLANFENFSNSLSSSSDQLEQTMHYAKVTLQNTSVASKQLQETMTNINKTAEGIQAVSASFTMTSQQATKAIDDSRVVIQAFSNQVLPEAVTSLSTFRGVMLSLQNVLKQLQTNPSALVRGQQAPQPGPGE